MSATLTVSLGIVRERESAKNKPTRTEVAYTSDMSADALFKENIANLAYVLWERRGCLHGSPDQDWREAEGQLRQSSERVSR
jgi:Protein of unknown function (DUF2934)